MDGFKIMDVFGLQMFFNMFPKAEKNGNKPTNDYTKYDYLVQTKTETKYIEIKCLS